MSGTTVRTSTRHAPRAAIIICDGVGLGTRDSDRNPFCRAKTQFFARKPFKPETSPRRLIVEGIMTNGSKGQLSLPLCSLGASEKAVGLPQGVAGNSELGHARIGTGQAWKAGDTFMRDLIEDRSFFENKSVQKALHAERVHLPMLLSDGGIHAHTDVLLAFLKERERVRGNRDGVFIHAILDGWDCAPQSASVYLDKLGDWKDRVVTLLGRNYAMDKSKRYHEATVPVYKAMMFGSKAAEDGSVYSFNDPSAYLQLQYRTIAYLVAGTSKIVQDCLIHPAVKRGYEGMRREDVVLHLNYRDDRVGQLANLLSNPSSDFDLSSEDGKKLDRPFYPKFISLVDLGTMYPFVEVAFQREQMSDRLCDVLAARGVQDHRIVETVKLRHATFYFDGASEDGFKQEHHHVFRSDDASQYRAKPQMRAPEIGEKLIALASDIGDAAACFTVNFANGDMLGHEAVMDASVKAIEAVDEQLMRVIPELQAKGFWVAVTADHGCVERTTMRDGTPDPSHTTNRVPFVVVPPAGVSCEFSLRDGGALTDIAPTVLTLMGFEQSIPVQMIGKSLIQE
ncbi:hypothetical protein HY992_03610 [Candidatus Micrarchaeota archaeon]|nr:hypothetical protein [Candidatus Micrarchaeota archaeon]